MSLFDIIFKNRPKVPRGQSETFFKMLDGYTPHFTTWGGEIYESELVRAAINARATHISKLRVEIAGAARPALRTKLQHGPNQFQTWAQFLYRACTLLDVHNTLFITPVFDEYGEPSGIYTPLPHQCEIVEYGGVPYLRYTFGWGEHAAIELEYCGIMTKFQYKKDLFGENNHALFPTMDLIHMQNQGIQEGVKSAATYRFMAQVSNFTKADDLAKERQRFTAENFGRDAKGGGLLLFPNTYKDIRQIEAKPWVIDDKQMEIIKSNVYEYFGVNEDVLENKAFGDAWSAFYEGAIEPFAIQFSEVLTKMLFTLREQSQGNAVIATSSRLQYMSNADKLAVSAQMADRGLMTRNEIREIWNLAPLPEPFGSQLPIRGEYYNANDGGAEADPEPEEPAPEPEEENNGGNEDEEGNQSV